MKQYLVPGIVGLTFFFASCQKEIQAPLSDNASALPGKGALM
jgi:hypothetical protein